MISNFHIHNIPKIYFGAGQRKHLFDHVANLQGDVVIITGSTFRERDELSARFYNLLNMQIRGIHYFTLTEEPTVDYINQLIHSLKKIDISLVIAIGGGSVLDAGKAVSAMLTQPKEIQHYLEGVGDSTYNGQKLPFIAMPTTAGTGSEVTANAVISQPGRDGFKKSLRHANLVPDIAIIDPELCLSCPKDVSASSGLDALTQLIESYVSTAASPFTDSLAVQGVRNVFPALERVYQNGNDIEARTQMAYGAMLSGITLANAGLGLVHGYAQPLGSFFSVPHGVVCGTTMAEVFRVSLNIALEEINNTNEKFVFRLATLARHGLGIKNANDTDAAKQLVKKLIALVEYFKIPRLSTYGVTKEDIPLIIEKTSLKNHPITLQNEQMEQILLSRL